jgi:hypothetical protein
MYVYAIVVLGTRCTATGPGSSQTAVPAPWYLSKTDPSFADMLTALRQALIAARFMGSRPVQPTNAEIRQVQQAWALTTA